MRRWMLAAVVGPALDGGFWALGLAVPMPGLCATVPMSTAATGARLRDALAPYVG